MMRFRVHLRSKPGPVEQYDGHVDVVAMDVGDACDAATDKLRHGAFPDRTHDMWIVTKVETIGSLSNRGEPHYRTHDDDPWETT